MMAPAFQFYADDFLAGTIEMSPEEVGTYIRLLCHQWSRGTIPNDDEKVRRIAGGKVSAEVMAKFPPCDDGCRRNARLERERRKQDDYRSRQSKRAASAWANRKGQPHATDHTEPVPDGCQTDGSALASHMPDGCQTDGSALASHMPDGCQTDGSALPAHMPEACSPSPSPYSGNTRAAATRAREALPVGEGQIGAEVPADEEILNFAGLWPGDLARAIPPKIPDAYTLRWLAWRKSGSAWPKDWKADLVRRFTSDWLMGKAETRDPNVPPTANGSAKSGRVDGRAIAARIRALEAELAVHPGNPDSGVGTRERKEAEFPDFKRKKSELRELQRKLAAGGEA